MTETAKTVLITGASSGIGLAAAVGAAQAGWHTIATMRDPGKADTLRAAADKAGVADRIEVEQLDVVDPASVTQCFERVIAAHGKLDALINNAGAGRLGTVERSDMQAYRDVMEVNYFGVVQATKAAMPHLRAAGGRVITVTSVGGVVGQPFNEAYCAAKFAVEGFMESLAPVAATVGVSVTVIEPGAVTSEFVANQRADVAAFAAEVGLYAPALEAYLGHARQAFSAAQTSEEAAAPIVAALTADRPAFRIQTSDAARGFAGIKFADLDGSAVQNLTTAWVH
jgi:NAD(P)-dependent dehydrogenase (short-subunit alcohol dehydrogenase family)